jgi:hypothetical protein
MAAQVTTSLTRAWAVKHQQIRPFWSVSVVTRSQRLFVIFIYLPNQFLRCYGLFIGVG